MHPLAKLFRNFQADFQRFGDYVVIDWHNRNAADNQHAYRIRYIINEADGELHVSGDLGSGVFYWYCPTTWQQMAEDSKALSYFLEKAESWSDMFYYDRSQALAELRAAIPAAEWEDTELFEDYTYQEFLDHAMAGWNQLGHGEFTVTPDCDLEIVEFLQYHDLAHGVGKLLSSRVKMWVVSLQMIADTQQQNDQISNATKKLFDDLETPFEGDYTLYFTDPDGTDDSTAFHLSADGTPADLLDFWEIITHDNEYNINCLDQIIKGPVDWDDYR